MLMRQCFGLAAMFDGRGFDFMERWHVTVLSLLHIEVFYKVLFDHRSGA